MTQASDYTPASGNSLPVGSIPALVTPMQEDGAIDWQAYRELIDWHIQSGTDAIVVMGSTGESATVSMHEHCKLISTAIDHAQGRLPIIAGTGANSTSEAIELTQFARTAGGALCLLRERAGRPLEARLVQHLEKRCDDHCRSSDWIRGSGSNRRRQTGFGRLNNLPDKFLDRR
jgi:dihydrodipicolinate synthase/N-acetylneuraminate lyase